MASKGSSRGNACQREELVHVFCEVVDGSRYGTAPSPVPIQEMSIQEMLEFIRGVKRNNSETINFTFIFSSFIYTV